VKALWRVFGVAYAELLFWKRQWMWLAQSLMYLLGFAVVAIAWGGLAALKHIIVVSAIAGAWGIGLNVIGQMVGWHKLSKQYEFHVASPLSLVEYYAGVVLGQVPFLAADVAVPLAAALLLGVPPAPLLALSAIALAALALGSFLALAVVLRIRNPMNISAVTNPLYSLTTILPPVYYPMSALPQPLRLLALVSPTTPLAELARLATGAAEACLDPAAALGLAAAWLLLSAVALKGALKWGLED
jgi:ABC-2 type transport system permease protein